MIDVARMFGYETRTLTLGGVLQQNASRWGQRPFLVFVPDGRSYSYADVDRLSNGLGNGLTACGIRSSDTVAVLMENSPEALLTFFALGKIGAVNAPINIAARGELLRYYLDLVSAVAVVADEALLDRLEEVRPMLPHLKRVIVLRESSGPNQPKLLPDLVDWRDLAAYPDDPPKVAVRFDAPALLTLTSGTTGPSKASVRCHAAMLMTALQMAATWGYRHTDVYYVCAPLFHINALGASTYIALMVGGRVALSRRFSTTRFWEEVRTSGATTFNLLGAMLNMLWNAPPSSLDRDHHVRFCRAVPVPPFAQDFEQRFGVRLLSTYGVSDYGSPTAFTLSDPVSKLGSAGRPMPGWSVRVVDEDDFEVPTGTVGQIVLRSEVPWAHASGYCKMPAETLGSLRNGWFHTGDLGRLDEDGYLFFEGRSKDVIRRRGENVSAWEVEQALMRHPAVADAAVYAVRSDMSEDEVAASIELRQGMAASPEELIRACASQIAYFMVPRFVRVVDSLPRTLSHKIEKFRLRQSAETDLNLFWDRERAGLVLDR